MGLEDSRIEPGRDRPLITDLSAFEEVLRPDYVRMLLKPLAEQIPWKFDHSVRVALMVYCLFEKFKQSLQFTDEEIVHIIRAALLHDIGIADNKRISPEIINTQEELSADDLAGIQTHPQEGAKRIVGFDESGEEAPVVVGHHAHQGETSYPASVVSAVTNGDFSQKTILAQQVLALPDTVDALLNRRPYRKWDYRERYKPGSSDDPWGDDRIRAELERKFGDNSLLVNMFNETIALGRLYKETTYRLS